MTEEKPLIRIVDDEESMRSTLVYLLESEGWRTAAYASAREFLAGDTPSTPGCLVLDVRMDEMSGLELQEELNRRGSTLPIVFYSAHGDIEMAVGAVKRGADDFLPKTAGSEKLLAAVAKAAGASLAKRPLEMPPAEYVRRWEGLSARERDVAELIAAGLLNKDISRKLQISVRTVYVYRVGIYKKLELRTSSDIALFLERVRSVRESGEAL